MKRLYHTPHQQGVFDTAFVIICKEKKINMMEFAEEIDISYEYLRHIVSLGGKKSLSFYSMYKIAKILGVSMDELCEGIFDEKQEK